MSLRNLLLILDDDSPYSTDLPSPVDHPRLPPPSSTSLPQETQPSQQPFPNQPFDSSIPLTVIVLLAALFFAAFFTLYVRCFGVSDHSPRRGSPSSASKGGADADVVRTLPVVGYGVRGGVNGDHPHRQSDCAVCLSEFEEGETVKVIPRCRHVFHPECLDGWLSSHVSCPVCRSVQLSLERKEGGEEK